MMYEFSCTFPGCFRIGTQLPAGAAITLEQTTEKSRINDFENMMKMKAKCPPDSSALFNLKPR
jgi:hypothetical protein